jgi:hypothetical protein
MALTSAAHQAALGYGMAQQQIRICSCGTRLARDNRSASCGACLRRRRAAAVVQPPDVPREFWADARLSEALGSWHIGRVFHAYRTHPWHGRAVSQETLAGWIGLDQAQLSRIESAANPPQDLGKLTSWAHSLAIPADLLWFKLPSNRSAFDADAGDTTNATEYDAMTALNRRSLLKGGIAAAALPGTGLADLQLIGSALDNSRRHPGSQAVPYFREQLGLCKQDDGTRGPKRTLPVVLGLLGAIEQRARDVSANGRRELLSVGADGAEFAGWLYRDIHRPDIAGYWYDRAMEWAQEADDPAMQGYVLLKKSQMAYDKRDAVRLLTLAQAAGNARWQLPTRVQAEVAQQEALGAAMVGEPLAAVRRKLDSAQALLTSASDKQPHGLGGYFTEHTLLLRNAVTLTEAGRPGMAAELFGDVIAAGTLSVRDGGFFNARRAAALALSGEPDEAATIGKVSAGVAHAMRSGRTVQVLNDVLQSMTRWRSRPAVREFREVLHAA